MGSSLEKEHTKEYIIAVVVVIIILLLLILQINHKQPFPVSEQANVICLRHEQSSMRSGCVLVAKIVLVARIAAALFAWRVVPETNT